MKSESKRALTEAIMHDELIEHVDGSRFAGIDARHERTTSSASTYKPAGRSL